MSTDPPNPPAVTVAVPTYAHAAFVADTLASVFAQTFADYEVVVVNDGSPDDTAAVLRPLVDAGRVRYVEQPNAGQAAARNRCLEMARGEFVAFLDDDDLWPADKLAWQVDVLRSTPDVDLVGGTVVRDVKPSDRTAEDGDRLTITHLHAFWGCPFVSPGQTLARTTAVRAAGGFDPNIRGADDFDLYLRMSRHRPLLLVRRPALHYREHAGNASRDRWNMLDASARCLRLRLPDVPVRNRWTAYRRAYRGLYQYVGRELLLAGGDVRRLLGTFWPGLAVDPKLLARFVGDCRRAG